MSCGVGHKCGSDPVLLWLWHRLAATAQIRLLAWEPPHAEGVALKRQKKKKVLYFKGYSQESEQTTHRKKGNIFKSHI